MLHSARRLRCGILVSAAALVNRNSCLSEPDTLNERYSSDQTLTNWSSTHTTKPARVYEPESAQEVCRLLAAAHRKNEKVRPVGTALSPNGIAFAKSGYFDGNQVSLASIDYIEVDTNRKLVTVGAGARVSEVLKKLNEHGLTLENFSSIQEQQMAGWTQVSAHGTGCALSTVDDMIVRMKLATPTEGLLTLSPTSNPTLFSYAKVGLGSLGVVTELTMKCIPKFQLTETTSACDVSSIAKGHKERLSQYRHVRYMWLPYTSRVISVVSNPTSGAVAPSTPAPSAKGGDRPTKPLYELLLQVNPAFDQSTAEGLSFSQLRDHLIGHAPLDTSHIKRVNQAEAQFWEKMCTTRTDDSTNILGFDCGGEQWVHEVCLPLGPLKNLAGEKSKDVEFVKRLLQLIEKHQVPTPCPIEQRWTARSTAPMSPAYSPCEDDVFSWVGIIMYMPPNQSEEQRQAITRRFEEYVALVQPLVQEYNAHCHWAKIELPSRDASVLAAAPASGWSLLGSSKPVPQSYEDKVAALRSRIAAKYPVGEFNSYRRVLDPKGILSNEMIDELFGSVRK